MKKIIFLIILIIFTNCKNDSKINIKNNSDNTESINDVETGIKTLLEFYYLFYSDDDTISKKNRLMEDFVSERIIKKIDSLSDRKNLILDYDPFIKGQDYFGNIINSTIKITPLKNKNQFRASFFLFGEKKEKMTNVDFLLKKNKDGRFLIYSILNDMFFNFEVKDNNLSFVKEKENIKKISSNWVGNYSLYKDLGKIDEAGIFIQYNIEIKKDSVFFSGQGYQTNFYDLCRVKKDKDTLKLYYYKSLEGTDYNKNKKQPLVKLYKKCSDYYVKSPSIWVDAKPNVEVKFEKTNFYSCKSSENNNVIIKKASFSDSKIHIELSNKKKLTFKAVYFLEDETPIISVKDNRIISSYGDHYGNYIEAKWVFNSDDKNLYLVDITGAFPLKNKMKDNFKDCVLHNLSKNINTINTDELFDILFNSCNCTYR